MEKEICTISVANNWLGDEYIFYDNNTIKRVYDTHSLNSDKTEWIAPQSINKHTKDKLIRACPEECKEQVMQILDYP
ncbi:hypothetical protein BOQ62_19705 [Chryseobacterium sp. CH21]|uniref:hypothetical protein n=1 Tax=Chryseobacterium sp. CH21 TaxID=713556 RepID=UPI00100A7856|nr:hypothetical protein [Chryseobacterium sp. CH21]RXM37925.1 hypothetical protein BOQ62_19705 [Chryseobacterium sp. CH21]